MSPLEKVAAAVTVVVVFLVAVHQLGTARGTGRPWTLEASEDSTRGAVCYAYTRQNEIRPAGCLWAYDRPAQ